MDLESLLLQAEENENNIDALPEDWIKIDSYPSYNEYVSDFPLVKVVDKEIGDLSKEISVKGEINSQYIEFEMDRYNDGIDLLDKRINVHYEVNNDICSNDSIVNAYYSDTKIKFGWIIPMGALSIAKDIQICIFAIGKVSEKDYVYITKPKKYTVNEGLVLSTGIVEPDEDWYVQFVIQIKDLNDNLLKESREQIDEAAQKWIDEFPDESELTRKIGEINSNLEGIGYGENGVKNLFKENISDFYKKYTYMVCDIPNDGKNYSLSISIKGSVSNLSDCFFGWCTDIYNPLNSDWLLKNGEIIKTEESKNDKKYLFIYPNDEETVNKVLDNLNIQLEEGETATQYKPYIPSVKMLAEEVSAQNESLSVIGKCKNLLKPTLANTIVKGVTITNNGDGTYTLNGTSTALGFTNLNYIDDSTKSIPVGKWRLVGEKSPAYLQAIVSSQVIGSDAGYRSGIDFEVKNSDTNSWVRIIFDSGATFDNFILKPMLVDANKTPNATYDDFVPYTGNGDTLTEDVASIKNDLSGLSFSVSGTTLSITNGTNTWTLEANS